MVSRPDGSVVFESRAEQGLSIDHVNLREKQRFMSGEKVGPDEGQLGVGWGGVGLRVAHNTSEWHRGGRA